MKHMPISHSYSKHHTTIFRIGFGKNVFVQFPFENTQFVQVFEDNGQFSPMLWNDMTWRPYRLSSTVNRRPNEFDNA